MIFSSGIGRAIPMAFFSSALIIERAAAFLLRASEN
jgi:hypothetical protein